MKFISETALSLKTFTQLIVSNPHPDYHQNLIDWSWIIFSRFTKLHKDLFGSF